MIGRIVKAAIFGCLVTLVLGILYLYRTIGSVEEIKIELPFELPSVVLKALLAFAGVFVWLLHMVGLIPTEGLAGTPFKVGSAVLSSACLDYSLKK